MKLLRVALFGAEFLGIAGTEWSAGSRRIGGQAGELVVDGHKRTYALHVAKKFRRQAGCAAGGGVAWDARHREPVRKSSRMWTGVNDKHGCLVVYPDGLERSWADGRCGTPSDHQRIDDVKFDQLQKEYKGDAGRIYATGMSNEMECAGF